MNSFKKLFETLNQPGNTLRQRDDLVAVLHDFYHKLINTPEDTLDIAYNICGLGSTDYVRALPDNDLITEIVTIAGELEIDPDDAEDLRQELIQKIASLS